MAWKLADHVEKAVKEEAGYERKYDHSPLVTMGYTVKTAKSAYDADADCDVYAATGNYHFKTAIANGESQAIGFETYEDALLYVDEVLVKHRVPGIWHIARCLEDSMFYVLPTKIKVPNKK